MRDGFVGHSSEPGRPPGRDGSQARSGARGSEPGDQRAPRSTQDRAPEATGSGAREIKRAWGIVRARQTSLADVSPSLEDPAHLAPCGVRRLAAAVCGRGSPRPLLVRPRSHGFLFVGTQQKGPPGRRLVEPGRSGAAWPQRLRARPLPTRRAVGAPASSAKRHRRGTR